MNKRKFVQQRRSEWRNFRRLIDQAESKRIRKQMSSKELADYSRLLREVSNDLAIIRSREWGVELAAYLNSLVTRGYNNYYTAPPGNVRQFVRFVLLGFPQQCRANWGFMLAGWSLFFIPFLASWAITQANPLLASRILPKHQLEQMEQMYQKPLFGKEEQENSEDKSRQQGADAAKGALGAESSSDATLEDEETFIEEEDEILAEGYLDNRSFMAGFYVKNNVGIAFRSFAIGILLGIGTCYVLLANGLLIGTSFGYTVAAGHGDNLLSFVVTHGAFELTAIAISGGAGLMLGDAVIHRRNRTWLDSLKVRGLDAMKIAFGAGVMLVVAAGIEAFWSPAPIDHSIKYIVGIASWLFVYAWLLFAGWGEVS